MTGVLVGSTPITGAYVGSTPVTGLYVGATKVWPTASTTWHNVFPWSYSWLADDLAPGAVSSWVDGQAGKTLAQATSGKQPVKAATTGPNSQPGVTFDGTNDYLQTSDVPIVSQPDTIIFVARSAGGGTEVLDGRSGRQVFKTDPFMYAGSVLNGATFAGTDHALLLFFNGATSVLRQDGTETTGNAGSSNLQGLTVGAFYDGTQRFLNGVVTAIGIVSGDARANGSFAALQAYVSTKWGLIL